MSWDILINKSLGAFALPPGLNLLWFVIGFLLIKKYPKISKTVIIFSSASLWLFSLPWFSNKLIIGLEQEPPINLSQIKQYVVDPADGYVSDGSNKVNRAIVVLAGSRITLAPEYGDIDTVGQSTLERVSYASWLTKKTNLPVLLSGGSVFEQATPLAVLMNHAFLTHFSVAPRWLESKSKNTAENAIYSSKILKQNKIDEILLVTHAWHMPRAKWCFENQGIKVISAPTGFLSNRTDLKRFDQFLPSAQAIQTSSWALHEMIGRYWYQLRYSYD
jgi:uncharacterized SAM-binding protein YcdF (DUF218 family)